jgi:hypothetical protein
MLLLLLLWISVIFFCIFFGRPGVDEVRGLKRPCNHVFFSEYSFGEVFNMFQVNYMYLPYRPVRFQSAGPKRV